jgi:regulation of enolase protein 1 (concanavalin A-like superfamily)
MASGLFLASGNRLRLARVTGAALVVAAGLLWSGLAAGPAAAATPGPGGIVSDEFNAGIVDGSVWHFVDPLGDSSLSASPGHAVISVPAGRAHDLWAGALDAPRLVQNVPNGDFQLEVKLDGVLGARYQMEGIVVQQDPNNLLRLEVHSDGAGTNLFAASFVNGSPTVRQYMPVTVGSPVYLRLARTGDTWTFRYSSDGSTWLDGASFVFPLTVSSLGVFAGSTGDNAGFTLPIDYVRDITPAQDTTPPAISAVGVAASGRSATVTWSTNEASTSAVDYGTTASYGSTASATGSGTSHSVSIAGLTCATTYHFRVRSTDGAGNAASSTDATFATGACPTTITPDEFDTLDSGLWRFYDPHGDSSASAAGGHAVISMPATTHDLWSGALDAPRLLEAVPNDDFEVELKLANTPAQRFEMQGLVVQQDASNLIRFEVHHDGSQLNLFAATFVNGSPSVQIYTGIGARSDPLYLRVKRVGSVWSVSYSRDGLSWTTGGSFNSGLTVTELGPFAGNTGGPPPAYSAEFDYLHVLSFGTPPPDTTPPVISAVAATTRATAATVTWSTDEASTSSVDYGTTAAYGSTASASGSGTSHSVSITGLTCATAYHFRVHSTDAAGNVASSGDASFTTGACPGAVVSDEFDGTTLDGSLWRLLDPLGDSQASVSGGELHLAVAGGASHDLWGVLNAPRLLQVTRDADFTTEAKFTSPVTQMFQMQGLVAQQDDNDLVRFDVYSTGSQTRLFGATFVNGAPTGRLDLAIADGAPLFLRMRRVGDTWTLLYSRAGHTWTTAASFVFHLNVSEVGVFAGNTGLPPSVSPAFTSTVDYFHNAETAPPPPPDTTPPAVSGVTSGPSQNGAVVTWTTDEISSSAVDYGTSTAYGRTSTANEFRTAHRVTLTGLACETTYHFSVRSADEDGNNGASPDATFTTGACPPPIQSDDFDGSSVDPRWSFSDPRGDSTLSAPSGGTVAISLPATAHDLWAGANNAPRLLQATRDEDFEVELRFQTPVTQQYQMEGLVVQQDDQNWARFEVHNDGARTNLFAAVLQDGRPITKYLSAVTGGGPVYLRVKRSGVTWTLRYSTDGTFWTSPVIFTDPLTVTALGPFVGNAGSPPPPFTGRLDYFHVLSVGTPPPDVTPPVVGNVSSTTTADSATVSWTTDEEATSTFRYGTTTAYGQSVALPDSVTTHSVDLEDLDCATVYHFQMVSTDEAGNTGASPDRTFTTGTCPPPDVTPPVISGVATQPNVRSAYVTWTTDERATSTVEYGTDTSYGQSVDDSTLVTTHRVFLPTLACGTQYHFRVRSHDKAGNLATSGDALLTTQTCPPPGGPDIDVWYGDDQTFGAIGVPQNWANVLGHASDPDGVAWVDYSLNGGPYSGLTINDSNPRIARFGDFNIELDVTKLQPGANYVDIVAGDTVGYQTHRLVTVHWDPGHLWPFPYTTDWANATRISDAAQVVDGLWGLQGTDVHPLETGYDRVLTFGERTWANYDVTARFTINSMQTDSPHSGFGLATGWQGHAGTAQPRVDYPYGMLCFYYRRTPTDSAKLWLLASEAPFDITNDGSNNALTPGVRYVMKMRTQNTGGGMAHYSCKVWPASAPEPSGWSVSYDWPARAGSVIVVEDYADVSVGPVTVTPIGG